MVSELAIEEVSVRAIQQKMDEVAPNEAGAARYKDFHMPIWRKKFCS